jgi:acyl-CoA thioester hydrolase
MPEKSSLSGELVGDGHRLPVRVYFEDTDFSGVVYHGALIRFLERGRSDFLRLLGIHHAALAAGRYGEPLFFAVRDLSVRFVRPARIDDLVEVATAPRRLTAARITLAQAITRAGEPIAEASVEVVLIDTAGRPRRLPPAMREKLASSGRHRGSSDSEG